MTTAEKIQNTIIEQEKLVQQKFKEIDFINGQISALRSVLDELGNVEEVDEMACKKGGAKKPAPKKKPAKKGTKKK